jgi:flagella basal body P-ring formation protein FlgA
MASLSNSGCGVEMTACESGEIALERLNLRAPTSLRERMLRLAMVIVGAVLLTAALAQAGTDPAPGAAALDADAPDLVSQIAARIAPLLPPDLRVKRVALQFVPPQGATLVSVAPGVTQLRSRIFMVELRVKGRTIAYSASLDAERRVLVAARDLAAGEPVTSADVETRWVEAFGAAPGALQELPDGIQMAATTPLRAGQPIYPSSLARPLAVRPGDAVTVLVRNGPVTVRTQLQARSAAAVGEIATLVNPTSGTLVTANVTGPKTAELVMQ